MIPDDFRHPEWNKARKCHDWRNYISEKLRQIWETFNDEQKQAIAESAEERADIEQWE